jgi:hypothetical protein
MTNARTIADSAGEATVLNVTAGTAAASKAVVLDGSKNIATLGTVASGALTVTGASTITTADNTDTLTLKSTDADGNSGPILRLNRDSGSPADGDVIGEIHFNADDDAGNTTSFFSMSGNIRDASNGDEDVQMVFSGFRGGNNVNYLEFDGDHVVFNEGSSNIDFRVESSGQANMLFIDGGNDRVHVNGTTGTRELNVSGDNTRLLLYSTNNSTGAGQLQFGDADNEQIGRIMYEHDGNQMTFHTNDVQRLKIDNAGFFDVASTGNDIARFAGPNSGGLTIRNATANELILHTATSDALIIGTAGNNERFRVTDAGIHLGGTGAANAFDDFEEGTWTMGITDGSNTMTLTGSGYNTGKYFKIGNKVYVQGFLDVQAVGSCSGNLTLTGLPFTCANVPNAYGAITVGYAASLSITAGTHISGYVEGNTSDIRLRTWDSTSGVTALQAGELSTGEFIFSGTYYVS